MDKVGAKRSNRRPPPSASAKLAFVEALLAKDTLVEASQLGVEWLVRELGVRQVAIALSDRERPAGARLVVAACHGLDAGEVAGVSVDLGDREHPVIHALASRRTSVILASALDAMGLTFSSRRCTAYPLPFPAQRNREPVGLVLLDGVARDPETTWLSGVLGRKLVDLRNLRVFFSALPHQPAKGSELAHRELDLIIDSVADPIVVTDRIGGMIMTNAPAERLFAAGPNAAIEETRRVRANVAHFSSHVSNLFFLEACGRVRSEIGLADPKTGAPVPVEAISGKIISEMGEVTAIVTILHDQTQAVEKARLYEELRDASDLLEQKVRDATAELLAQNELLQRQALELEAASSAKSHFLANMSHEFRTPLNAILGYTSMLLQGVSGPLSPPVTRQLSRVDSNGKRLLTIINDILDIARIEAGKMPLNLARFAIGDLVKEILAEIDPLIQRAKVSVRMKLGRKLPVLHSDRSKVKQILMNLISNALKFTPSGTVTVSAQLIKRKGELLISVADTGIGISKANQEAVFHDFRQVDDSPTRPYGGAGLGLAICRRLATHLGGNVRLASKLGEGSTFSLVLPLRGRRAAQTR